MGAALPLPIARVGGSEGYASDGSNTNGLSGTTGMARWRPSTNAYDIGLDFVGLQICS